jgi:hypothetical protein
VNVEMFQTAVNCSSSIGCRRNKERKKGRKKERKDGQKKEAKEDRKKM